MLSLALADGDADGDAAFFNTSYPLVDGFLAAAAEKTGRGVVYSCSWPAYTASGHGLPIQYDPWHDRSFAHLFSLAAFRSKYMGVLQLSAPVSLAESLRLNL